MLIRITFLNVPETGVLRKQLPSDIEIVEMIKLEMTEDLKRLVDMPLAPFDKLAATRLGKIIYKVVAPYFYTCPNADLLVWISSIVKASPAFHPPGKRKYSTVCLSYEMAFKHDEMRKRAAKKKAKDSISAELGLQYWKSTHDTITEIFKLLCLWGHPDENQAAIYAAPIYWETQTITDFAP